MAGTKTEEGFHHRTYPSWQDIDRPKPLFLQTRLLDAAGPRATIVSPDREAYLVQARKIQQALFDVGSIRLPIRLDKEIDPWSSPGHNLILLGNLQDNRFVTPLYARHYIAADAFYPGQGGHVLRTVHDPWANGCNAILVGGTDIVGVAESADLFISAIRKRDDALFVPPLLEIELGSSLLDQQPDLASDPDENLIEREMEEAHHMLETGAHGGITEPLARAGLFYYLTGKNGWAELFKRLAYLMYEDFLRDREQYGGPWGMDADFRLHKMMPAWDLVEEAPVFTDEDRLQITRIYAQFIKDCVSHASAAVQNRHVRHNHCTFAALGLMYSGLYFQKYYGVREAEDWLYVADECFVPQCQGSKPIEDSNGYQWLTLYHTMKYALARPYLSFFDEGYMRRVCDFVAVSMDNLGHQTAYGDTRNPYGWGTEIPLLSTAAWYYEDGRYRWMRQRERVQYTRGVADVWIYNADTEPVEPEHHEGIKCLPLDRRFYLSTDGPAALPLERAFDKIAFREDFKAESEYLLLDGLSCGGHNHYDGNSLIRLTAEGRIWLTDCDYYCSSPNFHNGVLPLRDGRTEEIPPFTWRDMVADLRSWGFTRTTVKEYADTDWERNTIWRKGHYFLIVDRLRALANGDYDFRAIWQFLGETNLQDMGVEVKQQDKTLDLINADGAALSLKQDDITSSNWDVYEFAEPLVHVLQQDKHSFMQKGQSQIFLNLLNPRETEGAAPQVRRTSDGAVLVREEESLTWLGVHVSDFTEVPFATDAAAWGVTSTSFSLAQATHFECGQTIFRADRPIDIEFDLSNGRGTIDADFATLLTLRFGTPKGLAIDGRRRAFRLEEEGAVRFSVPEGRHAFALKASAETVDVDAIQDALSIAWEQSRRPEPSATGSSRMSLDEPIWRLSSDTVFTVSCPVETEEGSRLVVGDESGGLWFISSTGDVLWQAEMEGQVTALTTADLGGCLAIVAGSKASVVSAFSLDGKQLWQYEVPYYKREGVVRVLLAADLSDDGRDEVITGAENWHYYTLDAEGNLLWQFESVHASTAADVADVDDDGELELIAATEYYWWHCVSADGEGKWQYNTSYAPGVTAVTTLSVESGKSLVAFGCRDGTVQVVDHEGNLRFMLPTADQITGLAAVDLDGDGTEEMIVTSAINYIYAIKADGEMVWRRRCQNTPRHLLLWEAREGETEIVVVEDGGLVRFLDADGEVVGRMNIGFSAQALTLILGDEQRQLVASSPAGGLEAWSV